MKNPLNYLCSRVWSMPLENNHTFYFLKKKKKTSELSLTQPPHCCLRRSFLQKWFWSEFNDCPIMLCICYTLLQMLFIYRHRVCCSHMYYRYFSRATMAVRADGCINGIAKTMIQRGFIQKFKAQKLFLGHHICWFGQKKNPWYISIL